MMCSSPPPLTDDQISKLLDGEAETALSAHLAQCGGCAARLERARQFERSMQTSLRRWDCPPAHLLGEYHLGLITGKEDRAIVRHLDQCALCRSELEELRVFLAGDSAVATPPVSTPQTTFRPRLGELVARLLPRTSSMALRGNNAGPIMAEVDGITLILDLQSAQAEQVRVTGQIVADDQDSWTGALVELRTPERLIGTAEVDDMGGFHLDAIPSGRVDLRVTSSAGQSVVLPGVELAV